MRESYHEFTNEVAALAAGELGRSKNRQCPRRNFQPSFHAAYYNGSFAPTAGIRETGLLSKSAGEIAKSEKV
jgi:hypothetical protein